MEKLFSWETTSLRRGSRRGQKKIRRAWNWKIRKAKRRFVRNQREPLRRLWNNLIAFNKSINETKSCIRHYEHPRPFHIWVPLGLKDSEGRLAWRRFLRSLDQFFANQWMLSLFKCMINFRHLVVWGNCLPWCFLSKIDITIKTINR